ARKADEHPELPRVPRHTAAVRGHRRPAQVQRLEEHVERSDRYRVLHAFRMSNRHATSPGPRNWAAPAPVPFVGPNSASPPTRPLPRTPWRRGLWRSRPPGPVTRRWHPVAGPNFSSADVPGPNIRPADASRTGFP